MVLGTRRWRALAFGAALVAGSLGTAGGALGGGGSTAGAAPMGVFAFGDAVSFGAPSSPLAAPIVGMAPTPSGAGYWLVAADGGIFSFGDAVFYGSTGALHLNAPVVAMAATASGHGYWLVAADGGIFSFGDAVFYGSMGGTRLNAPVLGLARTASGLGYWLVAADGGIFSFGDALFYGSTGGLALSEPVVQMAATPSGHGYWLVAGDGGIFAFGDAGFFGSLGGSPPSQPVVGIAATPSGHGYWLVTTVSNPPTCLSSGLSVDFGSSTGAAGSVGRTFGLTNQTLSTCMLSGYPGLQLVGPGSSLLATTVTQSTAFPVVSVGLVPRATAWFLVTYPSQTGFGNLFCPTSSVLGVVPPGNGLPLVIGPPGGQIQAYGGTTQQLACGQLSVTAVQPHPAF